MAVSFAVTSYGEPYFGFPHAVNAGVDGQVAYEVYDPDTGTAAQGLVNVYCTMWITFTPGLGGATPALELESNVIDVKLLNWSLAVSHLDSDGNWVVDQRDYQPDETILFSIGFSSQIWNSDTVGYVGQLDQQYGTMQPDADYADFQFGYTLEVTD